MPPGLPLDKRVTVGELQAFEESFQILFSGHVLPMWLYDLETLQFLEVNQAAILHYGYSREEFLGMTIVDIRPQEDVDRLMRHVMRQREGEFFRSGEWRHRTKDGRIIDVEIVSHTLRIGDRSAALVASHDITDRKSTERALQESEQRYRLLVERNLAGFFRNTIDGRIVDCNDSCARIFGFASREELLATNAIESYHAPEDRQAIVQRLRDEGVVTNLEVPLRKKDGSVVWVLENMTFVPGDPEMIEGTLIDISDRRRAEEQIVYLAYHDPLTSLPNRALLYERLSTMLVLAKRTSSTLAILLLDLDRFKLINDTMGHRCGDRLLQQVAARIVDALPDGDTVARIGGDEFMVVSSQPTNAEQASRLAERLLEYLLPPFDLDGRPIYTTASIGVALSPLDGDDPETVMRNADAAMYRAKNAGGATFRLVDPDLNQRAALRMSMENDLRTAAEKGELFVHYQPQIQISTGKVVGVEALLRWKRGDALVDPSEFISVAEESSLIATIGEWVLRTVCEQIARWRDLGFACRIAVNLSGRQFRNRELPRLVRQLLRDLAITPRSLDLEITETAAMADAAHTLEILTELKAIGVTLSMDDFGTGHSSLEYLRLFPIDLVKIDQRFVREMTDGKGEAIVTAVIAMSHALGKKVLAEGVERPYQLERLLQLGCEEAQGYLIGEPVSAAEIERAFF